MPVALKHVRHLPAPSDGVRVLVERPWPPRLDRKAAAVHVWLKHLGPSLRLARWYRTRPAQWTLFRKRYLLELSEPAARRDLERLYELAASRPQLTLLFAAADAERNSAAVLKELLEGMRKPPTSSGPVRAAAAAGRRQARPRR